MNTLPPEWYADHAPVDYDRHPRLDGPARHLKIEDDEPRLWTTSELILAAYWAGFGGIVVAVASVLLWTWWVS